MNWTVSIGKTFILLAAAVLLFTQPAEADVMTFSDRASWETAAGGGAPDFFEDLSGYAMDAFFHLASEDVGPFEMLQTGGTPNSINRIDAELLNAGGQSGVDFVDQSIRMIVGVNNGTEATMTIDTPVLAWGADFSGATGLGGAQLSFMITAGLQTFALTPDDGFFGFVSDSDAIDTIVFSSVDGNNEVFAIDNVAGYQIPEPTVGLVISLVCGGLIYCRRRS